LTLKSKIAKITEAHNYLKGIVNECNTIYAHLQKCTHYTENIFNVILLTGTPIADKNTQEFYTR